MKNVDTNDERVQLMCGLILTAVEAGHRAGGALTPSLLAGIVEDAITTTTTDHSGPAYDRSVFDAAVRRLVSEHMLVHLADGTPSETIALGVKART